MESGSRACFSNDDLSIVVTHAKIKSEDIAVETGHGELILCCNLERNSPQSLRNKNIRANVAFTLEANYAILRYTIMHCFACIYKASETLNMRNSLIIVQNALINVNLF